jgi:uncharacterized FAD-dependent dehydrogenase
MGYKELDLRISVFTQHQELKKLISKKTGIKNFEYRIIKKSLDARNKKNICWEYRIGINSIEIKGGTTPEILSIQPEYKKRKEQIIITGSGPAGVFSALFLSLSGFKVTLLERGGEVEQRKRSLQKFEQSGPFDPANNYAFGEGGAGTFSDGKLTSRTKNISLERNFIYQQFIEAGAPEEIFYMTHPHLGSDNLYRITQNFRKKLIELGCTILFNTSLDDLRVKGTKIVAAETAKGVLPADKFIVATGHSAYETYRMLLNKGVSFVPKNFALGFRAEHEQAIINKAQWGVNQIPGIKAAEYRLTAQVSDNTPVYSFCMCPGGKVVPSTAYKHTNIVNGMSNYSRNSRWANAAVVAGINLEKLFKRPVTALETLDWLEKLETSFYNFSGSYKAPASTITSFLAGKLYEKLPESSYPLALAEADFRDFLPEEVIVPLQEGLGSFCSRLKGYETGIILGLESKTSAPIQVERHPHKLNATFDNLYIAGEGSGWAGGIISSAADGLKVAQQILAG